MADVREHITKLDQVDTKVLEAVGKKINLCLQCGTCTASCPVNRFTETFNPRLILRAAMLGLKKWTSSNDAIWSCLACYSCTERCPRDVDPTEIIRAIRNLSVKRGRIHPFFNTLTTTIANFGRIFDREDEKLINEIRTDMRLPPIPPVDLKEVTKVLQYTNIKKLLPHTQ